jgi:hypothetical protein
MQKFLKKEIFFSEKAVILYFIIIKLILILYPYHYGIFRDEFLYISMSDRLGWGYLEVPPLPAFILAVVRFLIGSSYFSLHIIPAILGSIVIAVSALMVKKMGGSRYAVVLCMICVTFAPMYVGGDSIFTYDTFDRLFWTLSIYMVLLLLISGVKKYWLYFGIFAGLGLMSKITMLYLGFSLFVSFLLTKDRKYLFDFKFLTGGIIAFILFLPYIIWQALNGFPIVEYFINYTAKLYQGSPLDFFTSQFTVMNLAALPIWISGIIYFLFHKEGKKYRVFGLAYMIMSLIFIIQKAKFYLITPYYPVLFAGGSVWISGSLENKKILWLKPVIASLIFLFGLLFVPFARPIIPPDQLAAILRHGSGAPKTEIYDSGSLPQNFTDCFGWVELTEKTALIYQSLKEDEKKKVCILAENYGETGALHFYGPKYGLPDPICAQNIHYFWGPGNNRGEVMIIVGYSSDFENKLRENFDSVEIAGKIYAKYAMPHENGRLIFLCRGLHVKLKDVWKSLKHFG